MLQGLVLLKAGVEGGGADFVEWLKSHSQQLKINYVK